MSFPEYIMRFDTPIGTYLIDEDLGFWWNGSKVWGNKKCKTVREAKVILQEKYTEDLNREIKILEDKLEELKKHNGEISSYRVKL